MKRIVALSCVLLLACSCAASNSYKTDDLSFNRVSESKTSPSKDQMFQFLFDEEQKLPTAECLSGSDKCVTTYKINDEITRSSIRLAIGWLKSAQKLNPDAIVLELNTPGGSIDAGFDLVKEIEDSKYPVTCVVDNQALSMGSYILESCDTRIMTKRSSLMIHRSAIGGNFFGQADDWQNIADTLKATDEAMTQFYLDKLDVEEEFFREKTQGNRQWWLNYKEALKYGAIDRAVKSVKELLKEYQD